MIEDKKRKTRRVSKKVKKMHEEVVSKGIVGATPPELKTGGGLLTTYKIEHIKGDDVVSSELQGDIGINMLSLSKLIDKIDSGGYIRIEKAEFGKLVKIYKLKTI